MRILGRLTVLIALLPACSVYKAGVTAATPGAPAPKQGSAKGDETTPSPQEEVSDKETPNPISDPVYEQEKLLTLPSCKSCLTKDISFPMGTVTRSFHLYTPSAIASKAVIVLHGNGGSANQVAGIGVTVSPLKRWLDVAQRENIMLIIPNGTLGSAGQLGWNDCRADASGNPTANDVAFLSLLAKVITKHYGVSKHFATGFSNGGHMALRLAAEAPEVFSGVGIISAAVAANSQCKPAKKPISVLIMRGTADPISPYSGGQMASNRGQVLSMDESLSVFLEWNTIPNTQTITNVPDVSNIDNSTVSKITYPPSLTGTRVEGYVINGGGHTESSLTEFFSATYKFILGGVGEQNRDIECAEVVWNFFKDL